MRFNFVHKKTIIRGGTVFGFKGLAGYLCKDNHKYWCHNKYNKHTLIYHSRKNAENFLKEAAKDLPELKVVELELTIKEIK